MSTDYEKIQQVLLLHRATTSYTGKKQCEHCAEQCHSRSGLNCDDPDAEWPCLTVQVVTGAVTIK